MPGALFFEKSLARLDLPYQAHSASEQYESQRGLLWVTFYRNLPSAPCLLSPI